MKEEPMISASIYPNPTSDRFTIKVNGEIENGEMVVISDVLGRPVFTSQLSTSNSLTFNSNEVGPGFFLVHLEGENGQGYFLGKLVVQ